jgi:eukaryotic-like serine/threonine-protein kinase
MDRPAEPLSKVSTGARVEPEPPLTESRVLGGTYELLRRIDSGAMGTVFEAQHLRLNRRVAVKVLSRQPASRPEVLERFRQEAEMMSRLEHPHIATILDFDVTDQGEPYLVLELLRGETLEKRILRDAPFALEDVVDITSQVASALAASHVASVIHRDLKPANVFLTEAPGESVFVKLLDFGISKNLRASRRITEERSLLGTPEYMAPEQASGRNDLVDARSDQYSLAVVAYEMLTGSQPFDDEDLKVVLRRATTLDPTPPSAFVPWVPCALDAVLARALAKDPARRFDDILEFAREFAAAARNDGTSWFLCRRLYVAECVAPRPMPDSPRAAFLLSRIDDGMTVDELLDVAWMPRAEALRWLVRLLSCGAARFDAVGATGRTSP